MRRDSCKHCGMEMIPYKRCSICKQYEAFRCSNCESVGETQVHNHTVETTQTVTA